MPNTLLHTNTGWLLLLPIFSPKRKTLFIKRKKNLDRKFVKGTAAMGCNSFSFFVTENREEPLNRHPMHLENWASKLLTGLGQLTTKLLAGDGHCQLWAHACASIDKLEFQHLVAICYCVMCIPFNYTNVCKCPSTFCVKSPWGYHMSPANTFPLITPQGIYQVAIGSQKKYFHQCVNY